VVVPPSPRQQAGGERASSGGILGPRGGTGGTQPEGGGNRTWSLGWRVHWVGKSARLGISVKTIRKRE